MNRVTSRALASKAQRYVLGLLALAMAVPSFAQATRLVDSAAARRTVLVSIPDRRLAVIEGERVIAQFEIAVGAEASPSPTGEFQIVNRITNPTYYHAGTVIASGKNNPIGTRWVGLSQKGYGIHGTNAPRSVGHAASHGCVRLRNRDMERLFSMLRVGDVVQIRGERDEQIAQIFGVESDDTTVAESQLTPPTVGQ